MGGEPVEQQDGSFIVRIWWEHGGGDREVASHWRGWIQHVRNGSHLYFASLRDLTDFIERETGIARVSDDKAQGLM
ncbi:MAG TPA: hypothetical protein VKE41_13805 [Roseiflexaceae bacterium]|nr:hypothetical protein [Roseiflexaceae bacterium]